MKKISLYTLALGLLFVSQACNDKLTLSPTTQLPTDVALSTIKGVQAAVNGMYSGMKSTSYYGRTYLVIPELAGDNVYLAKTNSNRYLSSYRLEWLTTDGDVTNIWNQVYAIILRANNIIAAAPGVPDGTDDDKNSATGQALFIRALGHFDLLRVFAEPYAIGGGGSVGIPIETKFEVGSPKRNTQDEVYTQIIADLKQAQTLLPKDISLKYNANYYSATALLARVYLYKGDNANAVSAATEVINAGYQIVDAADLPDFYNTPGTDEDIFTVKVQSTETLGSDNLGQMYLKPGYGDIRVSPDLVATFDAADARLTSFIAPFTGSPSEYQNEKFTGQDGVSGLYSTKVLRISEMYLDRAEANAKLGNYVDALADLAALRAKRNLPALTGVADADVLNAVLLEERKEFMFEGHRYFDLLRNKIDIVRNTCNTAAQLNTNNCTFPAAGLTTIPPIPQREVDVNPNMEQNAGYKK
jgi:starch-binding outer membrane protein, SusD/RagB family